MSIKAVVFDYGQVICLPQDPSAIDRLAKLAGVERDKFEPCLWGLRGEYDLGNINSEEYYKKVLSSIGAEDKADEDKIVEEMIEVDLSSWKNINPETVTLMEDVKKAGYTLGILSNMPQDFLDWARENIAAFSLPHKSLFSCEVNLVKPDKAIYRKLLSMLEIDSCELVFFDDNEENVKSARDLGIEAFLWKDPENARQELFSLGVRLR